MSMGRRLAYGGYILGVLVLFLYLLFPSASVKDYIQYRVREAGAGLDLTLADIKPALPYSLRFSGVRLAKGDTGFFDARRIDIRPDILTLFGTSKRYAFSAKAAGGRFKGDLTFQSRENFMPVGGRLVIQDAALDQLPLIKALIPHRLSGTLNAKSSYSQDDGARKIEASLLITDGRITFERPYYTVESLDFQKLEGEAVFSRGRLQIVQCTLKGLQLEGALEGWIDLVTPPEKSRLNLSGNVRFHPAFIAELDRKMPVARFLNQKARENGLPFQISGTLEKPRFQLR